MEIANELLQWAAIIYLTWFAWGLSRLAMSLFEAVKAIKLVIDTTRAEARFNAVIERYEQMGESKK